MSDTAKPAGFWKRNQLKIAPWVFLAPGAAMFVLYVLIPIVQSVWISFHDWDGLGDKVWIGLGNEQEEYEHLFARMLLSRRVDEKFCHIEWLPQ